MKFVAFDFYFVTIDNSKVEYGVVPPYLFTYSLEFSSLISLVLGPRSLGEPLFATARFNTKCQPAT
jgi:hypothetical protein